MNIEDLTKTQLLLLTILVNFVTSIATGVLTVTLLDQAPPTVVQTVNRIVDHTIDTVATQVPVLGTAPDPVPTTEDLLTAAIAGDAARTVKLYRQGATEVIATGFYFPGTRAVFTVSSDTPREADVVFADGTRVAGEESGEQNGIKNYQFAADAALPKGNTTKLVAVAALKQGQTVIGLMGDGTAVTGIITRIDGTTIASDIPQLPAGAAAVNLSGDTIGISTGAGLIATDAFPAAPSP
jgi:hypothetical protein